MNEQIIQDWLAECAALSPVEATSFASSLKHNNEVIKALYGVFEDHTKFYNLIDLISKQLFNFYRSREVELKLFTLQFLPNLIYIYLNSVARGDKKTYRSVETLLIGIYNLEVVDEAGQPTVISFRLPSLAQASIYHEPMSLAHASLTETALRRLEECNTKLISWGPHPQVETLNAQNRLKTITGLLFIYNRHIGSLNKLSLKYLCQISSSLASQGFGDSGTRSEKVGPSTEGSKPGKLPRISVSSQLFLELLCGLYYAIYNDFGYAAMQAVEDIYKRSCHACYSNVIIVANAIINSCNVTSKGQPEEGLMGISVALSPATNTFTTVNKSMITNASFRTKKLPDDIPIISKDESGAGDAAKPLTAITEEKEESGFSGRGSSMRGKDTVTKNLQKLGIGKKLKDKDGKSSPKTNLAVTGASDKKQTSSNSKMSTKCGVVQNGDFLQAEGEGHGPNKFSVENGPVGDVTDGARAKSNDGPSGGLDASDGLDGPEDELVPLYTSNKNIEEKSFMQVSSV